MSVRLLGLVSTVWTLTLMLCAVPLAGRVFGISTCRVSESMPPKNVFRLNGMPWIGMLPITVSPTTSTVPRRPKVVPLVTARSWMSAWSLSCWCACIGAFLKPSTMDLGSDGPLDVPECVKTIFT